MQRGKRLLVFVLGFFLSFLSCQNTFAQEIKYSVGPSCSGEKVICKNPDEVPTCVTLNPKVHIETVNYKENEVNRFQPTCFNNTTPLCIDIGHDGQIAGDNVVIECIEFVKCEAGEDDSNLLEAVCSNGKTPKCLGSTRTPNCNSDSICNDSIPVCDFIWQASVPGTSYQ